MQLRDEVYDVDKIRVVSEYLIEFIMKAGSTTTAISIDNPHAHREGPSTCIVIMTENIVHYISNTCYRNICIFVNIVIAK